MNKSFCPYCGNPELIDAIPPRYGCNRPVDPEKYSDLMERIHFECLKLELKSLRTVAHPVAVERARITDLLTKIEYLASESLRHQFQCSYSESWEELQRLRAFTKQARATLSGE